MNKAELEKYILSCISCDPGLSINVAQEHIDKLSRYILNLSRWNNRTNLIGTSDPASIVKDLVMDSIYLAAFLSQLEQEGTLLNSFLDVGAGAGIPGIPFRILYNRGYYLMVEPRKKRGVFVNLMINTLGLKNTEIFLGPIEGLFKKRSFDICLSRAFCPWRKFLKLSCNYLISGGHVIIFSNSPWEGKNKDLNYFKFKTQYFYVLPTSKKRYFWLFSKKSC